MKSSLLPFFRPRGVVVVGASTSPEKLGYGVARNLIDSKYQGAIHFVSQKPGRLFGRSIFTDLAQVPDPVDLAVLVVPATAMVAALEACAARRIHAAILVSAGFREAGSDGAALERKCLEIARLHEIRLLGPNCIGILDTHLPLDTTFLQPPMPTAGGIGFVSHSGAFCAAIIDWSRQQGIGFSQVVSLGNQADINETDMLPMVADDSHTRVIVLYMEGVADGLRFVDVARAVTERKPVVAIKVGRFESGQRAAASHTGALAGSDAAFEAAFARAGILRADSTEQLFDWARAFEVSPLPQGRRVAVLTDAGGPGVIAADALETDGLQLAELSPASKTKLASLLPAAASVHNPVDMLAAASPDQYAACLQILLEESHVDAALVILPPPPMFTAESVADALIPMVRSSAKPVVIALLGSQGTAIAFERFNRAGIPSFPFPERAASALSALARRAEDLQSYRRDAPPTHRPFPLGEVVSGLTPQELATSYGIPSLPLRIARTADEAAAVARELGFPVVMKIASPQILHKSEVGGVLLNLGDAAGVTSGYAQMKEDVRAQIPGAIIDGVHIQHQVGPGQEVIVGLIRDPNFGPLIMFGTGGIEAEALKDVAFDLAPLSPSQAAALMTRTWAGRRLDGFRSIPAVDRAAVQDVLVRLSWLAMERPEVMEFEINPLRVLPQGAVALDIRATP